MRLRPPRERAPEPGIGAARCAGCESAGRFCNGTTPCPLREEWLGTATVNKACRRCAKRHTKCSGGVPCTCCRAAGVFCIYEDRKAYTPRGSRAEEAPDTKLGAKCPAILSKSHTAPIPSQKCHTKPPQFKNARPPKMSASAHPAQSKPKRLKRSHKLPFDYAFAASVEPTAQSADSETILNERAARKLELLGAFDASSAAKPPRKCTFGKLRPEAHPCPAPKEYARRAAPHKTHTHTFGLLRPETV